jgi:hypothetical protein
VRHTLDTWDRLLSSMRSAPVRSALSSGEAALAAFQRLWQSSLQKRAPHLGELVRGQQPRITQQNYEVVATRVRDSLAPSQRPLHGDLTSLPKQGTCWVFDWDGRLGVGLSACVDAATNEVVLVWELPEG